MKVKTFIRFHLVPEQAIQFLSTDINNFLKEDKSIIVISLSHNILDNQGDKKNECMATALLCYR
jgi:hypothetical protein